MITTGAHNLGIKPVQRKDLMDYFPSLAGAFAGYIGQMVFRVTLTEVLTETQGKVEAEMAQVNYDGSLNPLLRDASYDAEMQRRKRDAYYSLFRETLAALIEQTDWYRWSLDDRLAKKYEEKYKEYRNAGIFGVVKDLAAKNIGKNVKRMGGKYLSQKIASGQMPEIWGKTIGNYGLGSTHFMQWTKDGLVASPKYNSSAKPLFDLQFNPTDYAIEKGLDALGKKVPKGVDTSFNNKDTRRYYTQLLHAEEYEDAVGKALEALDVFTGALKYGEPLKMVNSFLLNETTAYLYHNDAKKERQALAENAEKWESLTKEIKQHIQQDIQSLTNEELTGLCKLLEVKQ